MWYVIQVQALRELAVAEKCRRDVLIPGEDVFVMMVERLLRKGRKWERGEEPAFQKYVFAELIEGLVDDFRIRLRQVDELAKVLKVGEEVAPILPEEEAFLKRLGGPEHVIRASEGYMLGEKLIITEGPMKGMEGLVKWSNRRQRVVGVAVSLMGQETIVRMGVEFVKRAQPEEGDA